MYCGKCGSTVPEGYEFCMKCGAKIEDNSIITANKKVPFFKKKKIVLPLAIALVLLCAIAAYFSFFNNFKIEGQYYSLYNDWDYLEFSNDGIYSDNIVDLPDLNPFLTGVYDVQNGKVTIEYSSGSEETYTIYKNYLVGTNYSYDGEIPKGSTFDITCTDNDSNYVFNSDGTMSHQFYDSNKNQVTKVGTYKRDGDIITCTYDDIQVKLLVYKNKLCNITYYKK